jgi:hypothetical protein
VHGKPLDSLLMPADELAERIGVPVAGQVDELAIRRLRGAHRGALRRRRTNVRRGRLFLAVRARALREKSEEIVRNGQRR